MAAALAAKAASALKCNEKHRGAKLARRGISVTNGISARRRWRIERSEISAARQQAMAKAMSMA
jgi:hypothetical protein